MGDEYKILRKLVRRGMQRWWRKQGMLWILLIALLLVGKVLSEVVVLNATVFQAARSPGTTLDILGYLHLVVFSTPPVIGLLFILTSIQVRDKASALCRSTILIDDKQYVWHVFKMVMSNAVVPLMAYLAYSLISIISQLVLSSSLNPLSFADILASVSSAIDSVYQFWFILIIIAIIIISKFTNLLVLISSYTAYYLSWLYNGFILTAIQTGLPIYTYGLYDYDNINLFVPRIIATTLVYIGFIYSIQGWLKNRHRKFEVVLIIIFVLTTLSSFHNGFQPDSIINDFLSIVYAFGNLNPICIIGYSAYESGTLSFLLFGNIFHVSAAAGWAVVSILNSVIMMALYYYGALYLLKLGTSREQIRTPEPAESIAPALLQSPHDTDAEKPH